MLEQNIYELAVGSERGLGETFPIDRHAPRGIFETDRGDIYLICDGPGKRFAVALQHQFYRPFQVRNLGATAIDHGTWLGVGKFCALSEADDDAGDQLGQLLISEDIIQMWVQSEDGSWWRPLVAYGAWWSDGCPRADVWALAIDDRIVFQHDGSESLFPEQLAEAVKALV